MGVEMPFENTGSKGEYLPREHAAVPPFEEGGGGVSRACGEDCGQGCAIGRGWGIEGFLGGRGGGVEPASTVRGKSETKPSDAKPKARSAAATPLEMPKLRKTDASKYNLKLSKDEPDTQTKVARVVDVGGKGMSPNRST